MKVNIGSILEIRGGFISIQGKEEVEISNLQLGLKLTKPVEVNGTVTNTGKGFLVTADLFFEYQVNCGRCLESFIASQHVLVQEQFVSGTIAAARNAGHEAGSASDSDLIYYFRGDVIDLKDCFREQIMLALPMSFICRSECKGFCANCGRNLNQQACNCTTEISNATFEKLKDLLITEGGGSDGKPQK